MRTQGDGGPDVQPPKSAIQETMTSGFYISVIVEVFFMFLCLYKMSNKLHACFLGVGELRQAVVAMMLRKDEVEEQNR